MNSPVTSLLAAAAMLTASSAIAESEITLVAEGNQIEFLSDKVVESQAFTIEIGAPDGRVWQRDYLGFDVPRVNLLDAFEHNLPDGSYHYQITPHQPRSRFAPVTPDHLRGLETVSTPAPSAETGTLTVKSGLLIDPNSPEPHQDKSASPYEPPATPDRDNDAGGRDYVVNDDLIVSGSACVGFDCVNNETFSFDTVKLKENNLRISFIDTSTVGGFPAGDWQLRANDSASGGADHFSIDWLGTGANTGNAPVSTPFRVDGAAPTNALRVSSTGRVGLRTANPVLDLHIATGNTPGSRYEQTAASGFTAQTWDVAGNEANFFVRDVTSGSRLPFRIRPGAPTSSIDIAANGNVGFGTASPTAAIHLRDDTTWPAPMVILENTAPNPGASNNLQLRSNAVPVLSFVDTAPSGSGPDRVNLSFRKNGEFWITNPAESGTEFSLSPTGDLTIKGNLTANGTTYTSSRSLKQNFSPIDSSAILSAVLNLAISQWNYKRDDPSIRHIGPMAEDFHAAFGLNGTSNDKISVADANGIALAAIQALHTELETKTERLEQLENDIAALREMVKKMSSDAN
jgi:hypothetical protein